MGLKGKNMNSVLETELQVNVDIVWRRPVEVGYINQMLRREMETGA